MTRTAAAAIPPDVVLDVQRLYDAGLYVQAYERASAAAPLAQWTGSGERLLAGRIAGNVGGHRLLRILHTRAFRDDPAHPQVRYYYTRAVHERYGPLAAWRFVRATDPATVPDEFRADWLALCASLCATLRDFETAEEYLARADREPGDRAWVEVERSNVFEAQDRYDQAVDAARRSLDLRPWYRPAVQQLAHLLQLRDRDAEAVDLLTRAARHLESGSVWAQLSTLQFELAEYDASLHALTRYEALSPLLDPPARKWLDGRLSDVHYHLGDLDRAREFARRSTVPFFKTLADNLDAAPADARRTVLPVTFVRQHRMTCAPATLSAVSRYWQRPADHLAVAEAICYDGTPAHSERQWATDNGYVAREFRVDWDTARALIDRGIPFTLTTSDATRGHLQAVVGYDERRGTLLIRDPFVRNLGEMLASGGLKAYESTGPRGMALVPAERADDLASIALPEAELYDLLHELQGALARHDRDAARAAYDRMATADADHRLTLAARRSLAAYDADTPTLLAVADRLLGKYPDDAQLLLLKLSCLRELGRRDDRVTLLERLCDSPGADPAFLSQYASELADDARQHARARRLLRRAIRLRPDDGWPVHTLAGIWWDRHDRRGDALEAYRFAACLDDKNEAAAASFFAASRALGRAEQTLDFLRRRFDRNAAKSWYPARTLFRAYEELDRPTEAFAVLDQAARLRPGDGELTLFAALAHARYGRRDRADELLRQADGNSPRARWLRAAAELATYRGDIAGAADLWRQVIEAEPLATDAHRAYAIRLAETRGRDATLGHLRAAADRFPHSYPLTQLLIEWERDESADGAEAVARRLVHIHPADAWSRRELATILSDLGRHDEALAELEIAAQLDPNGPALFNVRGAVRVRAGHRDLARDDFRQGIRLAVDNDYAVAQLMSLCDGTAERRESLNFVRGELERQVIYGDGLLAFREHALDVLEPEELLRMLREALAARPDLWHAHAAVVRQLTDMGRPAEARELAEQATRRFPLLPRLWLDLAAACHAANDRAGELDALSRAHEINPGWGAAARALAAAHERAGDLARARAILRQIIAREPLDCRNHGALAQVLWKLGQQKEAVECLEQAVSLEPGYDYAWHKIGEWSDALGWHHLPAQLARDLTRRRAGDARSWYVLGISIPDDRLDERLAALDKAIQLSPRFVDAHDARARILANAGRFADALEACRPAAYNDSRPPAELRARAAWVEAARGNRQAAIDAMKAVLADEPHHYWAWQRLAEWYDTDDTAGLYLQTARQMTERWPLDVPAWCALGEAHLRLKDRAAAKSAFRRAAELSPATARATLQLFDVCLTDRDLDNATSALRTARVHSQGPYVQARAVQLAAARNDRADAAEALAELLAMEFDDAWPIETALAAVRDAGWAPLVAPSLAAAAARPDANPLVGREWIRYHSRRLEWHECLAVLARLHDRGELERKARTAYVEALVEAKEPKRLLAWIRKNRQALLADNQAWAIVGWGLTSLDRMKDAARWLAPWRDRPRLDPWMTVNLVLALRTIGRWREAHEVSRSAVDSLAWHDHHALWLAADHAIAGSVAEADRLLSRIASSDSNPYYQTLLHLTNNLLDVRRAQPGRARRAAWRKARKALLAPQHRPTYLLARDAMGRTYRRALWPLFSWSAHPGALFVFLAERHPALRFAVCVGIGLLIALIPHVLRLK